MADKGRVPDVLRRRAVSLLRSSALKILQDNYIKNIESHGDEMMIYLEFFPLLYGNDENTKNGILFDTRTTRLFLKL